MHTAGDIDARAGKLLVPSRSWVLCLMFGAVYSALFLLGVFTEDNHILALVWPANAFMSGMLARFPSLARPLGWIACIVAFAIALPFIPYSFDVGAGLAIYNFGVVIAGYSVLSRFDRIHQRLERRVSVFYVLSAAVAASLYAGTAGAILVGPLFNDPDVISPFRYWFSAELLNHLAFWPMILTFPEDWQWRRQLPLTLHDQAPLIVLAISVVVGIFFGGMAALAFPIPALFWCAISYRVFLTALLTFAFCAWAVLATSLNLVDVSDVTQSRVLAIAMGAALISLGPLIISTTTATRNEILDQLRYLAAEREIVSNELEHRIKNLFALVNGLVSLSVRENPEMRPLANTLRTRLVALHQAHGLVRPGDTPGAGGLTSLQELIGALLKPYEGGEDRQFVVDGDDAFIDGGIVTPLALIFHELATNSTKYGALSDPQGELKVHIRRNIDELNIRWTERAPGANGRAKASGSSEAAGSGYGSKLLDLTIKSQLQGRYTRDCAADHLDIDIVLPGKMFSSAPPEQPAAPMT